MRWTSQLMYEHGVTGGISCIHYAQSTLAMHCCDKTTVGKLKCRLRIWARHPCQHKARQAITTRELQCFHVVRPTALISSIILPCTNQLLGTEHFYGLRAESEPHRDPDDRIIKFQLHQSMGRNRYTQRNSSLK